jgi:alpha-ribazole phosphatase
VYRLTLVRHAETSWNAERRLLGATDLPLSPTGAWQTARLRSRLAGGQFTAAYSSDLRRASTTAEAILEPYQGVALVQLRSLRELDFGAAEGSTQESQVVADQAMDCLAGGLRMWLAEVDARHDGGHVLVVSHGGPLRVLLCLLLGLPPTHHWSFRLDCAGVSVVDCAPSLATISLLNDRSHLERVT